MVTKAEKWSGICIQDWITADVNVPLNNTQHVISERSLHAINYTGTNNKIHIASNWTKGHVLFTTRIIVILSINKWWCRMHKRHMST